METYNEVLLPKVNKIIEDLQVSAMIRSNPCHSSEHAAVLQSADIGAGRDRDPIEPHELEGRGRETDERWGEGLRLEDDERCKGEA